MIYIFSDNALLTFAMDINGFKGPDEWGKDIFVFGFKGNETDGITKFGGCEQYPLVNCAV